MHFQRNSFVITHWTVDVQDLKKRINEINLNFKLILDFILIIVCNLKNNFHNIAIFSLRRLSQISSLNQKIKKKENNKS